MELHLTATGCHLPYGITQCYLPPDTSEHTPPTFLCSQCMSYAVGKRVPESNLWTSNWVHSA